MTLSIGLEARKIGRGDLRLKLQRRSSQQDAQGGGVRDLREKLSGSMHLQPVTKDHPKPKPETDAAKPARRSVIVAARPATLAEPKKVSNSTTRKKAPQKVILSFFYGCCLVFLSKCLFVKFKKQIV